MTRLSLTIFAAALLTGGAAHAADAAHPAVVELFQSQGCSSCPPANANVIALSDRPDLLTLSFHVTYWDQLGWKDTFDAPSYTARQWDYAHAFHRNEVATPQVVVNGRRDLVGSNAQELRQAIAAADRGAGGPQLRIAADRVSVQGPVGAGAGMGAGVWLVRYDPRIVQVAIRAGENTGKTLPHRNVVKQLVRLGDWNGAPADFALPRAADPAWKTAVFVQQGAGGPIIAAARA